MFTKNEKNGLCYYTSSVLNSFGFTHGFFTRSGGVSRGDFSSLNISLARKDRQGDIDNSNNVFENYHRVLTALGTSVHRCVGTTQVHGNTVFCVENDFAGRGINPIMPPLDGCDGLVIDDKSDGIDGVVVKTADCVPILFADKEKGTVAAVHAGWRGTVCDVVTKAAGKMNCNPENLLCAIGPSIGVCCYEVGGEVYDAVDSLFKNKGLANMTDAMFTRGCVCSAKSTLHANLPLINKTLLTNFGVPDENIDLSGICTCCSGDEFFSHRKSGGFSGTFPSVIMKRRSNE